MHRPDRLAPYNAYCLTAEKVGLTAIRRKNNEK